MTIEAPDVLGRAEAKRAFDQLWLIFRQKGRGSISSVERRMHLPARTLHQWRSRLQLRYSDLIAILAALGEDPGHFFGGLFPPTVDCQSNIYDEAADFVIRAEESLNDNPILALRLLVETYDGHWRSALAIAKAFRVLRVWKAAERWYDLAVNLCHTPTQQAICRLSAIPLLVLPRARPRAALHILSSIRPLLSGKHLATSYQYEGLALRACRDYSEGSKCIALALQESKVSRDTAAGCWQVLGLILSEVGDKLVAATCFRRAYNAYSGTRSRGHSLWALAQILKGEQAKSCYYDALAIFGSTFPFESFKMTLECFGRFGFDRLLADKLHAVARKHPDLFSAVLEDIEDSYKAERKFEPILGLLERTWNRWGRSQVQQVQLSLSDHTLHHT